MTPATSTVSYQQKTEHILAENKEQETILLSVNVFAMCLTSDLAS